MVAEDSILEITYLGYHKINSADSATAVDRFHIGSNTKAMTGFIAAKLVELELIKWDTQFFDLYPELKAKADSGYLNITLKELLSHRARIGPFTSDEEYTALPHFAGTGQEKRRKFAKAVLAMKPVTIGENTKYVYSNAGYTLAALMLEKVSGKSWEELAKQIFNTDLGLDIDFGWPNLKDPNQTWGHWEEDGKVVAVSPDYSMYPVEPAGDINITLPNYIRFIQLNLEGLSGKSNYLKNVTYQFLHNGIPDYSIGWANNYYLSEPINFSTHTGSTGTYFCYVLIDQKKSIAYIIMINSGTNQAREALSELRKYMKKKYGR